MVGTEIKCSHSECRGDHKGESKQAKFSRSVQRVFIIMG